MATEGLTRHHQDQVKQYLKFFRSKLDLHLRAIDNDFEDTKSDRLCSEDMLTHEDVLSILDSLCSAVKASVRTELQGSINMTALILRQMFLEADKEEIDLSIDTSVIEDRVLLEKVQRMRLDEPSEGLSRNKQKNKGNGRYTAEDMDKMDEEMTQLKKENAEWQKRYELIQKQHSEAMKEKNRLREQIEQEEQSKNLDKKKHSSKENEETNETTSQLKREIRSLTKRLEIAEGKVQESQGHLMQSKQFQQLKRMLGKKNEELKAIRIRLNRYEPDTSDALDDEDEDVENEEKEEKNCRK